MSDAHDLPYPDFPPYAEPYESEQPCHWLPAHLERIAQRDYVGVNEGYWILRDAASLIRLLLRSESAKAQGEPVHEHVPDKTDAAS